MSPVTRGFRNAFRNLIRTFSIVIILGISVGLSISMLVSRQAVIDKIANVKSSIGNTISISPAGSRGFEGGGEALTDKQMELVSKSENVTRVTKTLNDRLTSENTNLKSSIDAGSLGNRAQNNSGVGFQGPPPEENSNRQIQGSGGRVTRTFTPPVIITGVSNTEDKAIYGGNNVNFISGESLVEIKNDNKAVIGKSIAQKNNLKVGSTFTAYGKTMTIVGIYDAGNTFANNGVYVSLPTLQNISSQPGSITSATVTVDSIENIDNAVSNIQKILGDKADVTSNQDSAKTAIEPLESVKTISTYSVIGAIMAGAIIILLTMMMIVRERRREIGVMKAIGSSNIKIVIQFISEAVMLTVLGLIIGLIISVFAAQPITKVLVNNSSSSNNTQQMGPRIGGLDRPGRIGGNTVRSARNVETTVGLNVLAYGVVLSLLIAILGSSIPAFLISKVRPAEVMRSE